jgi:predicted adenine nucleotide alpha hydrolase (AANH) superfamily ATPase
MERVIVLDAEGKTLSSTSEEKARRLLQDGKAALVAEEPLTIRLTRAVSLPPAPEPSQPEPLPGVGKRILLHICCGPCGTYTIQRLRALGFEVVGFWYNPNIHPFAEHEKRRETLAGYAESVALPVVWNPGYDMPLYFRAVVGHEAFGERCRRCYRLRLEKAAQVAREGGFDAFTTTLLISIHQDQAAIRAIGDEVGETYGVAFFYENFRKGWAERGRMANEAGLYKQHYCGCIYSEWEATK